MNAIYKFVMAFLAKKSGKAGITTIPKASGFNVESSVKQIEQTLKNMGVDISKIKDAKEVQKYLNIHQSWLMKQTVKKPSEKILKVTKKKKDLPEWTEGWKPTVIQGSKGILNKIEGRMDKIKGMSDELAKMGKERSGIFKGINYELMEEKLGIKLLRNENLDELIEIEKRIKEGIFPRHQRRYDEAMKAEELKMAKDEYHIPDIIDPEDFAYGGRASSGLNYLLGEDDQNVRVPVNQGGRIAFGLGGFNAARRAFLKWLGVGTVGVGAAKSGLFSLLKGGGKKQVVESLTQVPIKAGVDGMPAWFKPLVNKVIKEGEDVTKKFSTMDREIVHAAELPGSKTKVLVSQDITTGNVSVDIGYGKHGFADGHLGQPVRLEYKAAEDIMTGPDADDLWKIGERDPHVKTKSRKEFKTNKKPEEFWVEEAEFTGGHPENVKFEESTFEKFGEHGSDFSEVEKFATGKVKKAKPLKKREITEYEGEKAQADAERYWEEHGDYASGGRVPLKKGKVPRGPNEWLQLLDLDWDDMDPDEWVGILRSLGIKGHASGGRVPFGIGELVKPRNWKLFKEFVEKLFIKSSNDIRRGEGIFKGLTEKQRIVQHDNLTKLSEKFRKTGKFDKGANQYFGIDAEEAFAKVEAKVVQPHGLDERTMIKAKYPGITDDLLNKILIDDNPQRKAEVLATLDQYFELGKRGKSMEEASEIVKQGIRHRTKQASGGLAGMLGE